ncbi:hypothetical protein [Segatella copri]|uniref:hypothetical protein n=1 Tax=Segatella copri TaxID=165179 RepID=UPI00294AB6B7|nr:hypothetical protein [Segatella copri]
MKKFNFQLVSAFFFSLLFFSCSQNEQNISSTASSEKNSICTASELGLSEADFSKLTPKQREQRAANIKLSEFVSLKDSVYSLTISQKEAEAMGISEEMYKNALNEMKVANEAIAKCNKEGKPITLTDVKPSIQESKKKSNIVSKLTSGRASGNQYGHIETYGNTEGYDAFMPREQISNVLFYCQSNAAITPVYTCKTYIFGKWNYGTAVGCLGVETKVKVLLAASGSGLTAKLCFATTDSNGGRCNWRAV